MSIFTKTDFRLLALAAVYAATAPFALAEPQLSYTLDGEAQTATISGANFSVMRMPQYDMETGQFLTDAPEQLIVGPVYVTRSMDSASLGFMSAVGTGDTLGSVDVRFDSGMTWTLKDARINNYNSYYDGTQQVETFEIVPVETTISVDGGEIILMSDPAD